MLEKGLRSVVLLGLVVILASFGAVVGTGAQEMASDPPAGERVNVALNKSTRATTEVGNYYSFFAVDGVWDSAQSRWISVRGAAPPQWLEIDLEGTYWLESAQIWTGAFAGDGRIINVVREFKLQYWVDGDWADITGDWVEDEASGYVEVTFDPAVVTNKVRYVEIQGDAVTEQSRVREIMINGVAYEN